MLTEKLKLLIKPEVESLGFILWGIEIDDDICLDSITLRIFIDCEKGISSDDRQKMSYVISGILDVEDPIVGGYVLEVSSPGVNRRIFTISQAKELVNSFVKVELFHVISSLNLKKFEGKIIEVGRQMVTLRFSVLRLGTRTFVIATRLNVSRRPGSF